MSRLFVFLILPLSLAAQNWTYDFGTGTGTHTTGASTTFLPATPTGGGTARVRVGTGSGSFSLTNPGLTLGSNTELDITAPTTGSVTKFSVYDYNNATPTFYTKFTFLLGDNSGSNSATSGTFYFFQGDGACFSDNNSFNSSHCFSGLRFQFTATGGLTTNYRNGSSWASALLSSSALSQGTIYTIEIYGNNTTQTSTYIGGSIAPDKWDLWVNGALVGDDLPKASLTNGNNIDSWMFYGESSTSNVAHLYIDDIEYSNSICSYVSLASTTQTGLNEQCVDGDWTYYGSATEKVFAIKKNSNSINPTVDINIDPSFSKSSTSGANQEHASFIMGRNWSVNCSGCSIGSAAPVSIRFFYDPNDTINLLTLRDASYDTLKGNGGSLAGTNPSTLAIKNGAIEWFKTVNVPYDASWRSNIIGNQFPPSHIKPTFSYGILNGVSYVELSGITSFSGGTGGYSYGVPNVSGGQALPVIWLSHSASIYKKGNQIKWVTGSEVNASHFIVEMSFDGHQFSPCSANIPAMGNSYSSQPYEFFHETDTPDLKFYRIALVNREGEIEHSGVFKSSPRTTNLNQEWAIFPNIIEDNNLISIHGSSDETLELLLYNTTSLLLHHTINLDIDGKAFWNIPVLTQGAYFVKLRTPQNERVFKIFKF